jgi:hypothetical protein
VFNLFRSKPPVINLTISGIDHALKADERIVALLNHNNGQLQEIRDLKKILRLAAEAAGQNDLGACREILGEYA